MASVRCSICLRKVPNLKKLKFHYRTNHSKIQIINGILKNSILNSTPSVLKRKRNKYKSFYIHDMIQIKYNDDTTVIEDLSGEENLSSDEAESYVIAVLGDQEMNLGEKKVIRISIRKVSELPKSLREDTGEFYECHCMEKSEQKPFADTESGSANAQIFYCNFCGGSYQTGIELSDHVNLHQHYYCRLCSKVLSFSNYPENFDKHLITIYACYICGLEFTCKEILMAHLSYHFEQQTFENILDMEQDYNRFAFCNTAFSSGDYFTDINNILFFLSYPYDHRYIRNTFMKVACDICYQEVFICDYEQHLKVAHFMR